MPAAPCRSPRPCGPSVRGWRRARFRPCRIRRSRRAPCLPPRAPRCYRGPGSRSNRDSSTLVWHAVRSGRARALGGSAAWRSSSESWSAALWPRPRWNINGSRRRSRSRSSPPTPSRPPRTRRRRSSSSSRSGVEPGARPQHARPDRYRGCRPPRDRRHVVPPDDLRLPERWRQLRGEPREPRREPVARRRRVTARRLHPHRRGVDLGRCRRHRVDTRVPRLGKAPSAARARADRFHQRRQLARDQGVGPALRSAHLHLHREPFRARPLRAVPRVHRGRHPPHQPERFPRCSHRRNAERVPAAEGLLVGRRRAHRCRGDLERCTRVPSPGVEERREHAALDGLDPREPCSWASRSSPTTSVPTRARTRP